jgi:hypothetical protein
VASKLAIVVASCDKFSDMWEPLFDLFFKYWNDCPYPVYLVANHKTFDHPRVSTLLAGEDSSWSSTILNSIKQIDHSHILFWIDDAFPIKQIDTRQLTALYNWMLENQANFLRLRPDPKPSTNLSADIGILDKNAAYRVSLFATIWNRSTLQLILNDGESAWDFELKGTERSASLDKFYSVRKPVFEYLHGVERGVWIRPTAKKLKQMGYNIDSCRRKVMSIKENLWYRYRLFKSFVFHLIPESKRLVTLKFIQVVYKKLGIR